MWPTRKLMWTGSQQGREARLAGFTDRHERRGLLLDLPVLALEHAPGETLHVGDRRVGFGYAVGRQRLEALQRLDHSS